MSDANTHTHDELRELVSAHALGALDAADVRSVEDHLEGCAACRASYDAAIETAAALALSVPAADPPPGLRDRVLAAARSDRHPAIATATVPRRRRRFVEIFTPSRNLAAAFALAAGLLGVLYLGARQDVRDLEAQAEATRLVAGALSQPGSRVVALEGPGGSGGAVVLAADRRPVVVAGLLEAPPGKVWEVWTIPAGGQPVSVGLLHGGDDHAVELDGAIAPGSTVAITIEPDDGLHHAGPTGAIALSGGVS
jgi:anti-sigma-K factor RskA